MKSFDVNILTIFKMYKTGFLSPKGELIPVHLYGHFEQLKNYPEFRNDIEKFENMVADESVQFADGFGPDDHIEWHHFEMWKDDEADLFRQKILRKAYDLGWARVGLGKKSKDRFLELETTKKNISKLKKSAKSLAEMLDAELIVTDVDKFQ